MWLDTVTRAKPRELSLCARQDTGGPGAQEKVEDLMGEICSFLFDLLFNKHP